ncbi:hypothetical protein BGW38_002020 [Lunasporangiospora selenospora]|uniref:SIT4 phosphatase-associated protein n=1 Tax=Lunasporangiospora selenospora TaxID=979761 RepID=A0A9P6FTE1_9FUNG|nr:hypothetical protein BGW38_002020 [Lunasporangiospora selenospora]
MYWRFGHQNTSVIEHLLEAGNVSLEELLEQDDLIQECKSQNPRLIDYLRDPSILQQLLSYITSDDLEDRARFKYPFIACEIFSCDVWGIFESVFSNVDMLVKFWEYLDRPPPLNPVQASYFAKVVGVFLMKKTNDMLHFIKSQPEVVPKLLLHMSTSPIMDLLLKIISMEESPDGKGTVQIHSMASQVLLDIIAISQSSHPEQPSIGTNVLIDELKSELMVSQLVTFMLDRNAPHSSSTLINGVTIFIELIRRNNSDYDVEPTPPNPTEPVKEPVDLSDLLKVLATRIEDFKELLLTPRSITGPIDTSIGKQTPLGFERLKICEMFAELLHCSNMAILNSRPIISVSTDGSVRIPTVTVDHDFLHEHHQLPLAAGSAEPSNSNVNGTHQNKEENDMSAKTEPTESKDKKISPAPANGLSKATNAEAGAKAEDTTKAMDDQATPKPSPPLRPASSVTMTTLISATISAITSTGGLGGDTVLIPVGDFLKLQFVDHRILPTCFDLFFQFPWNNFLHTVVYDMVHQVFHRPMGDIGRPDNEGNYIPPKGDMGIREGWNRRLTISMFRDGQLTKRITDAQRLCDYECAQPKGVRLGYMGHLTYIADETVKLLELYSQTSLLSMLCEFIDQEDWWNYVSKVLKETKERDAQVLGGSRPNVIESHKPDHDDGNDDDYIDEADEYGNGDFLGDVGAGHEGDVASDQFARYLCQQITTNLPDKFGSSDEDDDDDDGSWIGEYGGDSDFEMRHAGTTTNSNDPFGANAIDFDSEDDEGIEEEAWSPPWSNGLAEAKPSDPSTGSQATATLAEWSGNAPSELSSLQLPDQSVPAITVAKEMLEAANGGKEHEYTKQTKQAQEDSGPGSAEKNVSVSSMAKTPNPIVSSASASSITGINTTTSGSSSTTTIAVPSPDPTLKDTPEQTRPSGHGEKSNVKTSTEPSSSSAQIQREESSKQTTTTTTASVQGENNSNISSTQGIHHVNNISNSNSNNNNNNSTTNNQERTQTAILESKAAPSTDSVRVKIANLNIN